MSSKNVPEPQPARWSLAARLTAWYTGWAFLLIAAATGFISWALIAQLDREDDQFLADKVRILRTILRERPDDADALKQEVVWALAGRQFAPVYVRVLGPDGTTRLETPRMAEEIGTLAFPEPVAADEEPGGGLEVEAPGGKAFRLLAARAPVGMTGQTVTLQLAFDQTYEESLFTQHRRSLALVLGLALVLSAFIGYRIARRGLEPVAEMSDTARRIRSTTLNQRLELGGLPSELSALAVTFNEMLDRLEESFTRLSRFSADIAHELRTPVNNLRGEAEVALNRPRSPDEYRQVLGSSLEECGRLTRLIDSLLFMARAESPEAEVRRERLDVSRELEAVREFYHPAAAEASVELAVRAPGGIVADLDRTLFQRAVGNLVANALAHTPAGGSVSLRAAVEDGAVIVEVADTGSGIPPEHLPHVFDRFYRADPVRTTSAGRVGLGLSIVRTIAHLHRGSASITSTPGQGTRVRLAFPPFPATGRSPPAKSGKSV